MPGLGWIQVPGVAGPEDRGAAPLIPCTGVDVVMTGVRAGVVATVGGELVELSSREAPVDFLTKKDLRQSQYMCGTLANWPWI